MTWYRGAVLLLFTGWLCLWLSLATAEPQIAFISPPSFVTDRDVVIYQVRVPRHPDNRLLVIAAVDGDLAVQSSRREMDGEASPALWNVRWALPEGSIRLVASVYGINGREGHARHDVTVIGTR